MGLPEEIARLEQQIAERERQTDLLRAELKGMKAALRYVGGSTFPQGSFAIASPARLRPIAFDSGPSRTDEPSAKRGGRQYGAISKRWQQVLSELYGHVFDAETVAATVKELEDRTIRPAEVRRIFEGYVEHGLAEKTEEGLYRVSAAAAEKYGFKNKEGRDERPSENDGGEMVRERGYPPSAPGGSIPPTSTGKLPHWSKTSAEDDDIPF